MGMSSKIAAYTLIGMAEKFQDFFYDKKSADVTFKFMNNEGEVKEETVPNISKIRESLDLVHLSKALADRDKLINSLIVRVGELESAIISKDILDYNKEKKDIQASKEQQRVNNNLITKSIIMEKHIIEDDIAERSIK